MSLVISATRSRSDGLTGRRTRSLIPTKSEAPPRFRGDPSDSRLPMCDASNSDATVVNELVAVAHEHLLEQTPRTWLFPGFAEQRLAVGYCLVEAAVTIRRRVPDKRGVCGDAELQQQHEKVGELRDRRQRCWRDAVAQQVGGVGDRTFAKHDEDALARRPLELLDERNDVGNAVQDVAADDQVRRRDLGVFPGARDDGQVGQRRKVGAHALRRFHRGDPFELLRQRHRVPSGAGADVDERLARRDERLDHRQELVDAIARRAGVRGGAPIPVIRIAVAVRGGGFAIKHELAPALHPVGAANLNRRGFHNPHPTYSQNLGTNRGEAVRGYHAPVEFSPSEAALLSRYFTNLDRPVFALRNLPEVVKGALFSRYSRTEKSLRRVLLDEFINEPDSGFDRLAGTPPVDDDMVAVRRAEEFYERVLVGYGDDSVAELAGGHVAVERVSTLAAKALEDSRIGISPLEKSTRYVRFDRRGRDGRFLYHRGLELAHPDYEPAADGLFETYSALVEPVTQAIRERFPIEEGETDRAWKAATRAKALDMLRGLLPAGTLTNLGLFGNGRAFEYLITKLAAHDLLECRVLASALHRELSLVIPSFVRRALDERYGAPAAKRLANIRNRIKALTPSPLARAISGRGQRVLPGPGPQGRGGEMEPSVRLIEFDPDAEKKVVAATVFPHSNLPLEEQSADVAAVLESLL